MKINIKHYSYCIITLLFVMVRRDRKKVLFFVDKKSSKIMFCDRHCYLHEKIAVRKVIDEAMYRT
jgi:hypothetical protein